MEPEVVRLIDASGLGPHVLTTLKQNLARAVRLRAVECAGAQATGSSRFGGLPDLPPGAGWPGPKLHFLAQINLAEVGQIQPDSSLPRVGLLSFFYNAEEHPYGEADGPDAWRVLFIPPGELQPAEPPVTLAEARSFPTCRLQFAEEVTLPPSGAIDVFSLRPRDRDLLWDLYEEVTEQYGGNLAIHRLLGHPTPIQHNPLDTVGDQAEGDDWMLLLQVDTDPTAALFWGDSGMLYFCIRRSDLEQQRFDQVRVVFQCC
jgi:uncharacterized protein YwqG